LRVNYDTTGLSRISKLHENYREKKDGLKTRTTAFHCPHP